MSWQRQLLTFVKTSSWRQLFTFISTSPWRQFLTFVQVSADETRDHIEVCPVAGQTVQEVARRIKQHGGFGLFIDYGHTGEKGDTFRVGKFRLFCSWGDNSFWGTFWRKICWTLYFFAQNKALMELSLIFLIFLNHAYFLFTLDTFYLDGIKQDAVVNKASLPPPLPI